jgi:Fe-S cluster biogenesis protein NfuA
MDEMYQQVETVLEKIRPFLKRDGGDIELIGIKDGIVYVKMTGACDGCSYAMEDIAQGVDIIICEEVPGVIGVQGSENVPEDVMTEYLERKNQKAKENK